MTDIKIASTTPKSTTGTAFEFIIREVDSYDIVSDPMVISKTCTGYNSSGSPSTGVSVKEFPKSEYGGEVV